MARSLKKRKADALAPAGGGGGGTTGGTARSGEPPAPDVSLHDAPSGMDAFDVTARLTVGRGADVEKTKSLIRSSGLMSVTDTVGAVRRIAVVSNVRDTRSTCMAVASSPRVYYTVVCEGSSPSLPGPPSVPVTYFAVCLDVTSCRCLGNTCESSPPNDQLKANGVSSGTPCTSAKPRIKCFSVGAPRSPRVESWLVQCGRLCSLECQRLPSSFSAARSSPLLSV
jgi:hypothetical protein